MSDFIETHLPCPCGESSDAFSLDKEGNGFCFSCNKPYNKSEINKSNLVSEKPKQETQPHKYLKDVDLDFGYIAQRGIPSEIMEMYNVRTAIYENTAIQVRFPYPSGAEKVRTIPNKTFFYLGDVTKAKYDLFGRDKFDPGSYPAITITEGEFDALAVRTMLGKETASVSVPSSSAVHKTLKEQWDYLNSFDKIVICFDNDEPGRKAAEEAARLFDYNKIFFVNMTRFKDANEYLLAEEVAEFRKLWYAARRFQPEGVISSFKDLAERLHEDENTFLATYPLEALQTHLHGLYRGKVVVFKGPEGIGKQLANTTPIPTPTGWTTMGNLVKGDIILGADGKPTKIIEITNDQMVDCYEVSFEDGTFVIAGGPHKWKVYDDDGQEHIKTTEEIYTNERDTGYRVPLPSAMNFTYKKLLIDPYILGYWLGDGHSYSRNIYVGDQDKAAFEKNTEGFIESCVEKNGNYIYKPVYPHSYFKKLGLIGDKHIPISYLRSSINQRMELLSGLMDSDGGVHEDGTCEFYTSNKKLKDSVLELIRSLGYKCKEYQKISSLKGVKKKIAYTLRFKTNNGYEVFRYNRKARLVKISQYTDLETKGILNITPVRTVPSRCLEVDNKDHLFICDYGWTVTHNSEIIKMTEHHLLKNFPNIKVGAIHVEEADATVIKAIATYEDKYPYVSPDVKVNDDQIMKAFRSAVKDNEERFYLYTSYDINDEKTFLDRVRFLVAGIGCDILLFDHITWFGTGLETDNETQKLDRLTNKLKEMAEELGFCIVMISHVNDDGKASKSRNVTKVADVVINMFRDKESLSEYERMKLHFSSEKSRIGGYTGPLGYAVFDRETMTLGDPEVLTSIDTDKMFAS